MSLLEPHAALQKMCAQIVLAIIEFSKPGNQTRQTEILQREITALRAWVEDPDIRGVLLESPLSF
jgi:hypothetical protein